jgi:hypothetical protein
MKFEFLRTEKNDGAAGNNQGLTRGSKKKGEIKKSSMKSGTAGTGQRQK